MNALNLAQQAYAPTNAPIKSQRSIEYEVIARITYRIKQAVENDVFPELLQALHENRKLWRVLASDVADSHNQLPEELRARIFYLADFTDQHTSKVIARKASARALLEVNTLILRGLK